VTWDPGPHQNTVIKNNIFAGGTAKLHLYAESGSGVTLTHNLWHLPGAAKPFNWLGALHDHAGWVSTSGQGTGDVLADPKFVGAWELPWTNLRLAAGSPAIDKGETIASVTHDFEGKARPAGAAHDIGALEHGATATTDGGGPPPLADSGSPGTDGGGNPDGPGPAGDGSVPTDSAGAADLSGEGSGPGRGEDGCSCGVGSTGESVVGGALLLAFLLGVIVIATRRRDRWSC
jgi:MYXO-CTERM domain-containing protein